jgi:hypothetical protein
MAHFDMKLFDKMSSAISPLPVSREGHPVPVVSVT